MRDSDQVLVRAAAAPLARPFAALAAAAMLVLGGCVVTPPAPPVTAPPAVEPPPAPAPEAGARYRAVTWDALPGWSEDRVGEAWSAFLVGCKALLARASTTPAWRDVCAAADPASDPDAAHVFFEAHFSPYEVSASDGTATGLVTGYYEPLLEGSRTPTAAFGIPLYATPADLLVVDLASLYPELRGKRVRGRLDGRRVVPYWSRADIMNGHAPADRTLVYVEDPVEAFFLEIQGSGRVALADGSVMRVGYADQNGHPYKAIGRVLADRGAIPLERMSMQAIRDWGRAHPDELPGLLAENPSYVFFREVPPPAPATLEAAIDGPLGAFGVPLAAGRTIAVDPRSVPLGTPVFLATTWPSTDTPLARLVMAQDTGGAIRGAVRADFFWGFGPEAGREAGRMKQTGRLWVLWPRDAPPPGPPPTRP